LITPRSAFSRDESAVDLNGQFVGFGGGVVSVGRGKGGGWRERCRAGTFDSVIATVQSSLSGSLYSSNETSRIEVRCTLPMRPLALRCTIALLYTIKYVMHMNRHACVSASRLHHVC
jgi:hypothetical protein